MFDFILIALLQSVAGDPAQATPPAPAAVEAPASAGETPTADAPAADAPAATEAPAAPPAQQFREERVCERLDVATGERMPRRRCRTIQVPIEPEETAAEQPAPQ
jgi:hypothetical protein